MLKRKQQKKEALLEWNARLECKKCLLDESEEWLVRGKGSCESRAGAAPGEGVAAV